MYLTLFSNPIQSIARIALTHLVRNLSLPTLTVALFTSLYQIVRISINSVGIVPTFNTLMLIRRYLNGSNLTYVGLQNLFQNTNSITVTAILETLAPFWNNCITKITLWAFSKLFNLFIFTIFFAAVKNLIFRLINLAFVGLVSVMTSLFYFELPSLDFIKDLIKPVTSYSKDLNQIDYKMSDLVQSMDNNNLVTITCLVVIATVVGTSILVGISLTDWENLKDITLNLTSQITNITTWPFRVSYRGCARVFNWFFPPRIT